MPRFIDITGKWSESTGLKSSTIRMRLSTYKWSPNDALTKGVTYP